MIEMTADERAAIESLPESMRERFRLLWERAVANEEAGTTAPPPTERPRHARLALRRDRGIEAGFDEGLDRALPWKAMRVVERFLAQAAPVEKSILILAGLGGTGKSTAAAFVADRPGGLFVKAWDIVQGSFDEALWARLREARYLAVDDFGTERLDAGGWGMGAIHRMIDLRYDSRKLTVFTTQLARADFLARYGTAEGERTRRRLEQRGAFVHITETA